MSKKGLSIVIPIYNFKIKDLVEKLSNQAKAIDLPFEIRCYDDCSDLEFKENNRTITSIDNVIYVELPENLGRSKIRNKLAEEASYSNLLFIDGDSEVNNPNFIKNYLPYLDQNTVVYGGRSYNQTPPKDKKKTLHWIYGSTRESVDAETRSKSPYYSFMSNNFITPKDYFLKIKMDERLKGYGYEDTLFGITLRDFNVEIKHIDNPLAHLGLEDNEVFLSKTCESVKNLFILASNNIRLNTRLLSYYEFITKLRLKRPFEFFYGLFQKKIESNLDSDVPSLFYFDLYKLKLMLVEHQNLKT